MQYEKIIYLNKEEFPTVITKRLDEDPKSLWQEMIEHEEATNMFSDTKRENEKLEVEMQFMLFRRETAAKAMDALTNLDNTARKYSDDYEDEPSMFQQTLMAKAITDWRTVNEASGN